MVEGQESFTLNLSSASHGVIARASMRVTIIDNDNVVATPSLSVRSATVDAGAGTVTVPVLMGGPSGQASASTVTVHYATADATAAAGTDYTATSGTLTFDPGETVQDVVVDLSGTTTPEAARSFKINLSSPNHAVIADASAMVTIGAHGATALASPTLSLAPDLVIGEGDGYLDVPVTLSAPATTTATVELQHRRRIGRRQLWWQR